MLRLADKPRRSPGVLGFPIQCLFTLRQADVFRTQPRKSRVPRLWKKQHCFCYVHTVMSAPCDGHDSSTRPPWLNQSSVPLDFEIASHYISYGPSAGSVETNRCFYTDDTGFAVVEHMPSARGERLLSYVADSLRNNRTLETTHQGLGTVLAHGLEITDAGVQSSALVAQFAADRNVLRCAWAGAAGLIVVRDREVLFRSYLKQSPEDALEHTFRSTSGDGESSTKSKEGDASSAAYVSVRSSEDVSDNRHWDSTALDSCVQSAFVLLEDGDLVLAGSQSFFANLSEDQIVSFVRPVQDPYDVTLSIANATCLGSFRKDDAVFISYYLSHLAHNFATSQTAKPLLAHPFPPSPMLEDVIVIAAACAFS